jgi:hypothetical protein
MIGGLVKKIGAKAKKLPKEYVELMKEKRVYYETIAKKLSEI